MKKAIRKPKVKLSAIVNKVILQFVKMGPEKWIKGANAKDANGCEVSPTSKKACSFCNQGVVMKVTGRDYKAFYLINNEFRAIVHMGGMINFNDRPYLTFGQNLEARFKVREALKKLGE